MNPHRLATELLIAQPGSRTLIPTPAAVLVTLVPLNRLAQVAPAVEARLSERTRRMLEALEKDEGWNPHLPVPKEAEVGAAADAGAGVAAGSTAPRPRFRWCSIEGATGHLDEKGGPAGGAQAWRLG